MIDSLPEEDIKHLWISGKSNGVFDGHYSKSGAVSDSFEIWVSRIDPNTAGFYGNANRASVGSEHIFNTINGGFVSIGSSKTSGSDQMDGFMYYAFEHNFIGESFREWVNERVKRNQYSHKEDLYDWFYGESIIGDPMQKLAVPEQSTTRIIKVKAQQMLQKSSKLYDLLGRIKGFFNIQ